MNVIECQLILHNSNENILIAVICKLWCCLCKGKGCVFEDLSVFCYLEFLYLQQLLHFFCIFQHCFADRIFQSPSIPWYVKNKKKFLDLCVTCCIKAGNHELLNTQ